MGIELPYETSKLQKKKKKVIAAETPCEGMITLPQTAALPSSPSTNAEEVHEIDAAKWHIRYIKFG